MQLLLTALLVFAAGGGSYNLSVTNTKSGDILPIMATTNSSGGRSYITNYVVIKVPQGVTFTVTPTDSSYTNKSWDFHDAGTPNHINGTNETVMVHFASTNTPITNTPVTIVSSRVDDTGRTCKTTQTVIHLLPVRFRLLNGDTNTADIDGKDFNYDRPTTMSATIPYATSGVVNWTTNAENGIDLLGDVPLGQGRSNNPASYVVAIMMLAKVSPTNSAPLTYGWNRVYEDQSLTISKTTTNTWYVDEAPGSSTTPQDDNPQPVGNDKTAVPSTNKNVLVFTDAPGMAINLFTSGAPNTNDLAYEKTDFTYSLTNAIGSTNSVVMQHVGQRILVKRIATSGDTTTDWAGQFNIVSTTNIPNCQTVSTNEIRALVAPSTNAIIFDASVPASP